MPKDQRRQRVEVAPMSNALTWIALVYGFAPRRHLRSCGSPDEIGISLASVRSEELMDNRDNDDLRDKKPTLDDPLGIANAPVPQDADDIRATNDPDEVAQRRARALGQADGEVRTGPGD